MAVEELALLQGRLGVLFSVLLPGDVLLLLLQCGILLRGDGGAGLRAAARSSCLPAVVNKSHHPLYSACLAVCAAAAGPACTACA
jgi:hypothetical protein